MAFNWEAISAISEALGAVAVIATLIYLSAQIRQNTKALTSQRFDERTRALREINIHTGESEWYWRIIEKLQEHLGTDAHLMAIDASVEDWRQALSILTPTERGRFISLQLSLWNHYQNMFHQHEAGFLDEELFAASKDTVSRHARLWVAIGLSQKGFSEFDHFVVAEASAGGA